MSQNSDFLKNTLEILETDPEVKSYIYQQILEFNQFVTPETLVMVLAKDPKEKTPDDLEDVSEVDTHNFNYRIAIVLKDQDTSIESEAYDNDIFKAIFLAKEKLVLKLLEIQAEVESPQDRMNAIKEARENKIVH